MCETVLKIDCLIYLVFRLALDAGIPYGRYVSNGITFHDLRHSYGSYLMEQGTNFRATQELMRHENPKMTQRYTHVADDTRKRAVNSLDWNLR